MAQYMRAMGKMYRQPIDGGNFSADMLHYKKTDGKVRSYENSGIIRFPLRFELHAAVH